VGYANNASARSFHATASTYPGGEGPRSGAEFSVVLACPAPPFAILERRDVGWSALDAVLIADRNAAWKSGDPRFDARFEARGEARVLSRVLGADTRERLLRLPLVMVVCDGRALLLPLAFMPGNQRRAYGSFARGFFTAAPAMVDLLCDIADRLESMERIQWAAPAS
jgi:hypothetical protein